MIKIYIYLFCVSLFSNFSLMVVCDLGNMKIILPQCDLYFFLCNFVVLV